MNLAQSRKVSTERTVRQQIHSTCADALSNHRSHERPIPGRDPRSGLTDIGPHFAVNLDSQSLVLFQPFIRVNKRLLDGNGYLRTVCDYVHLNPVRAKLIRAEQPLRAYRWSSYNCSNK
jgi:hypothetical protein